MIVFILLLIILLIVIGIINEKRNEGNSNGCQISVNMSAVRTIYDEQRHLYRQEVLSDTSNGRLIDGHPLRTNEDWERWSVYEKKARDASEMVSACKKALSSSFCDDPEGMENKARSCYREFESLCSKYGMWNYLINDNDVYIPTIDQKQRSEAFLNSISSLVPSAIEKRDRSYKAEQIICEYLKSCPRHTGYRADIIRVLSSNMDCPPSESSKILRVLYNRNVLKESKNQNGRIVVRKRTEKKDMGKSDKIETAVPEPPAVNLSKSDFASIDDLVQALKSRQIEYIDNRSKGGCLWVKSTLANDPFLLSVTVAGVHLIYVDSVRRFKNFGGYYIKPQ